MFFFLTQVFFGFGFLKIWIFFQADRWLLMSHNLIDWICEGIKLQKFLVCCVFNGWVLVFESLQVRTQEFQRFRHRCHRTVFDDNVSWERQSGERNIGSNTSVIIYKYDLRTKEGKRERERTIEIDLVTSSPFWSRFACSPTPTSPRPL